MKHIFKKITLIAMVLLLAAIFSSTITLAAEDPTPTTKPSLMSEINSLKEKIASRVAQLKLVEKKGFVGTVTDISSTLITLNDINGDTKLVDVDEITKFTGDSSKSSFGLSDITKGMKLSVLGLYNKESKRLLARFIDVVTVPVYLTGKVTAINRPDYSFTLTMDDNKTKTIDIETYTKTQLYSDGTTLRTGFSKMQEGYYAVIFATPNQKDSTRASANRILLIPSDTITSPATPTPTINSRKTTR